MLQANPELTPAQVKQLLEQTAVDMAIDGHPELLPGYDVASGHGMVDSRAAVLAAQQFAAAPPVESRAQGAVGSTGGGALGPALLLLLWAGRRRRRA